MSVLRWTTSFVLSSALCAGCGAAPPTPTLVAAGQSGPYVHADGTVADLRNGLAMPPGEAGWPPAPVPGEAGQCVDEQAKLETDLGVASIACPAVQRASVPAVVDADADAPIAAAGFQILCYALGHAVLVVEYSQTGTHCSHVVGLAVFNQAPKR